MRIPATLMMVLWSFLAMSQQIEHQRDPCPLIKVPHEIMFRIVAELSSGYWLECTMNLFTSSKSMYKFLTDDTYGPMWQNLAIHNNEANGHDEYILNRVFKSLSQHQFALTRLLMGYGGITFEYCPKLKEAAEQRGDEEAMKWLSTAFSDVEKKLSTHED